MPAQDFRKAMGQHRAVREVGSGRTGLGVFGELVNPEREKLDQEAIELPVREIKIENLLDNPYQYLARNSQDLAMEDDALEELAASIRENGFFGALLARPKPNAIQDSQYELAYGHRRRAAAIKAGLKALPVKIVNVTDIQMARIMASENFSRQDLSPIGEANVVGLLYTQQNLTVQEIANVIGRKRGWVEPRLALYEAPPDVKAMVTQKPESFGHVRHLTQIRDETYRRNLITLVLEEQLTREDLSKKLKEYKTQTLGSRQPKDGGIIDTNITISSLSGDSDLLHNRNIPMNDVIMYDEENVEQLRGSHTTNPNENPVSESLRFPNNLQGSGIRNEPSRQNKSNKHQIKQVEELGITHTATSHDRTLSILQRLAKVVTELEEKMLSQLEKDALSIDEINYLQKLVDELGKMIVS